MYRKSPSRWIVAASIAMLIGSGGLAVANDIDGDVRGGYNAEVEEALVGGGVLTAIGDSKQWYLNPNAEFTFLDAGDSVSLNGDVHYDFPSDSKVTYWLGAGPAVVHTNPDIGDDDTDLGVNLLAGLGAREGKVRPFTQGKVVLKDDTEAAIAVGIRF